MSGVELSSSLPISVLGNMGIDILSQPSDLWGEIRTSLWAALFGALPAYFAWWLSVKHTQSMQKSDLVSYAAALRSQIKFFAKTLSAYEQEISAYHQYLNSSTFKSKPTGQIDPKHMPPIYLAGLEGLLNRVSELGEAGVEALAHFHRNMLALDQLLRALQTPTELTHRDVCGILMTKHFPMFPIEAQKVINMLDHIISTKKPFENFDPAVVMKEAH